MDGWQLASRITDQEAVADTPRVLLSPIGLLAGEAKMKRLHWFQGYAKKPVRESDLVDQMRLALNDVPELLPVDEGVDELEQQAASRPRTIVVAEDHDVNQTLFRTILEKMGHRTILASDGVQAIEAVESNEVDLVFMDVQMPRKNGYQATEAVRAKGFSMPIIAVTANAMKGEREKCVAVGMNDFLGKPFGKSDLARLLDRWLPDRPEDQEQTNDQQVDIADTDRNEKARSYGDAGYDLSEEELGTSLDEVNVAVFDRAAALERFMGKSDIVEKVVVQFIAKQTAALTEIREAAEQDRFDEVRSGAHAIKGGAWSIDAQRLGNVAAFLEASAKLEDRERISHYVDRLETAMNEFQREVADGGVVDKSD
jgi:CheY-like chemotaxis protein/HPt (histidine-containing phosphotransfer) domain-containing protein